MPPGTNELRHEKDESGRRRGRKTRKPVKLLGKSATSFLDSRYDIFDWIDGRVQSSTAKMITESWSKKCRR
jgi:hypothetical protein